MSPAEEIISIVFKSADAIGIHLMLVGAAARDFWLKYFDLRANVRTTIDVDLACGVSNWEDYQRLMASLLQECRLMQDPRTCHRLWLADEICVDIVPFGGIENQSGEIAWPPNFDRTLNVLGFQAAYNDAEESTFGKARIRVIRPHWLAFLKMNAYTDNQERTKDLKDLYFLTDNYIDLIDADRLLYASDAPDSDILSMKDFDSRVGGALLIARHCRRSNATGATALQDNVRRFNANGILTDAFCFHNGIPMEMAEAIINALLSE